jgi:hypothetical protein
MFLLNNASKFAKIYNVAYKIKERNSRMDDDLHYYKPQVKKIERVN